MSQTVVERTAENITESAHQASRATSAIADAFEDSVGVVRCAVKQSGDAAEEFLNDTTQRVQRHFVLTVAMTFLVGITSGALIGWMMKRRWTALGCAQPNEGVDRQRLIGENTHPLAHNGKSALSGPERSCN